MYENVGLLLQEVHVQKLMFKEMYLLLKKNINQKIINQFELNPLQYKKRNNNEIIQHEIKYKIEVELDELKEKLENEGINELEVENKIKK